MRFKNRMSSCDTKHKAVHERGHRDPLFRFVRKVVTVYSCSPCLELRSNNRKVGSDIAQYPVGQFQHRGTKANDGFESGPGSPLVFCHKTHTKRLTAEEGPQRGILVERLVFSPLQVYGLRQFRKTQSQDRRRRRRSAERASEPAPGIPSNTTASRTSPRRPVRRRRPSHRVDAAVHRPRPRPQEQGENSSSSNVGRASGSPTTVCFGRSVEASGPSSGGRRTARSVDGEANSVAEGQPTRDQNVEVRAEMLQRALESMRSKVRCCEYTLLRSVFEQ